MVPVTERPNFGSLSSMECPPTRDTFASFILSPAPRRISERISFGKFEVGKATMLRARSEEHTSELQSRFDLVCRLLLEKKKQSVPLILVSTRSNHQVDGFRRPED